MKQQGFKNGYKFLFIPLFFGLITTLVYYLWNWLMPDLFHLTKITFIQAGGLLLLSRILVGGFHFGGKHKMHRSNMREKFMGMSDEEKQAFKEQWKQRCGK